MRNSALSMHWSLYYLWNLEAVQMTTYGTIENNSGVMGTGQMYSISQNPVTILNAREDGTHETMMRTIA